MSHHLGSALGERRPWGLTRRATGVLAVAILALSVGATAAVATGNKILFHSSLKKPTSAIQAGHAPGISIQYADGKLVVKSLGTSGFDFVTPTFSGNDSQLADVSVSVTLTLGPTSTAGLFCRGPNQNTFYDYVISTDGTYSINKISGGNATGLTSENIATANQYHLTVMCTGPPTPGATGMVNMKFHVTTPSEGDTATFTDSTAALGAGPVGLIVAGQGLTPARRRSATSP